MEPIRYTGRFGIAKLDPKDQSAQGAEKERYVQKTFFPIFDTQKKTAAAPNFEPPIAEKTARGRQDRSLKQQYFEFEDSSQKREILPSEDGFSTLYVPPAPIVADTLELTDGSLLPIPQSIAELKEVFNLYLLNDEAVMAVPGQLREIARALSSSANMAFQGRTGSGKTFVELIIASSYLSRGDKVLLLAPTEPLVNQHTALARTLLSLAEDGICSLTGQIEWRSRAILYRNTSHLLYISTPETLVNDVIRGNLDPGMFTVVLYDEGHRAVGEYAYVQFDRMLPKAARRLVFSATLARNYSELAQLFERLGVNSCHEIPVSEAARFVSTVPIRIRKEHNPELYEASKLLFNAVVKSALRLDASLARATERRDGLMDYLKLVKTYRKMTNISACRSVLEGEKQPNASKSPFSFPSFRPFHKFGDDLKQLAEKYPKRFGRVVSEFYELQHLMMLYSTLTCEGQFCFLTMAGQNLWNLRFSGAGKVGETTSKTRSPKNFHRRVYAQPDVLKAFAMLSEGTHFFQLQSRSRDQFQALVSSVFPNGIPERAATRGARREGERERLRKLFFAAARRQMVERDYVDHPQEITARGIVQRHCTFGRKEPIFVYNASAQGTLFYIDRLAYHLGKSGIRSAAVVGKKHLKASQRNENLAQFDKNEVQILGINSAANEGLHIQAANTLVRLSHSSRPIDIEQVIGRVGRKEKPAYIYNVVTLGTHDEYRFYSGLRNQKRMRQAIRIAEGRLFGPSDVDL